MFGTATRLQRVVVPTRGMGLRYGKHLTRPNRFRTLPNLRVASLGRERLTSSPSTREER